LALSTENIPEKIVQEYLKYHKASGNDQKNFTLVTLIPENFWKKFSKSALCMGFQKYG